MKLLCWKAALLLLITGLTAFALQRRTETTMRAAALTFLSTLTPEQKSKTLLPFDSEERLNWHYVPKARAGLNYKEMTPRQQEAALALLRVGLSEKGGRKIETIRRLETVLRELENQNPIRDPSLFYFTVFGEPSETSAWGWRYEGHHISLHWTVLKGQIIASSPQFLGANPAEVRSGPMQGTRVLSAEEDLARALLKSFTPAQRAQAVLSDTAPPDIITGAQRKADILEHRGIAYGALTKEQQGILQTLLQEYASTQAPELAKQRLEALRKAGLDKIKFAWMGGLERGQGHYYRIQGTTFLIEYDNTQNNANHVHTVWRDFHNDFGADLLEQHYRNSNKAHNDH